MHELSLCQSALELIEQQAQVHHARRVTAVWLELGALSCVEENALRFGFASVCRRTLAEGCRLELTIKPAQAWCWQCAKAVSIEHRADGCPLCGGYMLQVQGGDGLQLKQIEVE